MPYFGETKALYYGNRHSIKLSIIDAYGERNNMSRFWEDFRRRVILAVGSSRNSFGKFRKELPTYGSDAPFN